MYLDNISLVLKSLQVKNEFTRNNEFSSFVLRHHRLTVTYFVVSVIIFSFCITS